MGSWLGTCCHAQPGGGKLQHRIDHACCCSGEEEEEEEEEEGEQQEQHAAVPAGDGLPPGLARAAADGDGQLQLQLASYDATASLPECLIEQQHTQHQTTVVFQGNEIHKAALLRILCSTTPSSKDRALRVANASRYPGSDAQPGIVEMHSMAVINVMDSVAGLVRVGQALVLGLFRVHKLEVVTAKGTRFSVPDITQQQLDREDTLIYGRLMLLQHAPDAAQGDSMVWCSTAEPGPSICLPSHSVLPVNLDLHMSTAAPALPAPTAAASGGPPAAAKLSASVEALSGLHESMVQQFLSKGAQPQLRLPQAGLSSTFPYRRCLPDPAAAAVPPAPPPAMAAPPPAAAVLPAAAAGVTAVPLAPAAAMAAPPPAGLPDEPGAAQGCP
jgi:hypothetical protein